MEARPLLAELGGVDGWLDDEDIPDGTPFLIAPDGSYDVVLNSYFLSFRMAAASRHTQEAAARDLARFLDFLWCHRPPIHEPGSGGGGRPRSWRDAIPEDRRAFEYWRCRDESGPLVAASTWDREVSSVNGFYRWAVHRGHLEDSPIAQRPARSRPQHRRGWAQEEAETPAERRPDALLAEARQGTARPTVSAPAQRAGITRPTLYRNYPALVEQFTARAAARRAALPRPESTHDVPDRITKLRHENEQLRLHLDLYEEHIRRLTTQNAKLTDQLARAGLVTDLAAHRDRRSNGQTCRDHRDHC